MLIKWNECVAEVRGFILLANIVESSIYQKGICISRIVPICFVLNTLRIFTSARFPEKKKTYTCWMTVPSACAEHLMFSFTTVVVKINERGIPYNGLNTRSGVVLEEFRVS